MLKQKLWKMPNKRTSLVDKAWNQMKITIVEDQFPASFEQVDNWNSICYINSCFPKDI